MDEQGDENANSLADGLGLQLAGHEAMARGDFAAALHHFQERHTVVLDRYGPSHGLTGTSLLDLAVALHLMGRQAEARSALEQALNIYESLERTDGNLDRLEDLAIGVCSRQGHFFAMEEVARRRIARLAEDGAGRDYDRAVTQDRLAQVLLRQERVDEALSLLNNSIAIFERESGPDNRDTLVCYQYLARAYQYAEQFGRADEFCQRAVESASKIFGARSLERIAASDDLAATRVLWALHDLDLVRAHVALEAARAAHSEFVEIQGANGRNALISSQNIQRLEDSLSKLASQSGNSEVNSPSNFAIPSNCFISHSYRDTEALASLLQHLPQYVKPILFAPIDVAPTEYVSSKLVSGLSGADGVIFIDSVLSNRSFWTAFERNLAARLAKPMFRFDADSCQLSPHVPNPKHLPLISLFDEQDSPAAEVICRWLVDEQGFLVANDHNKLGARAAPRLCAASELERQQAVAQLRNIGKGLYLIFLSEGLLSNKALRTHVFRQALEYPDSTLFCWLGATPNKSWWKPSTPLQKVSKDQVFELSIDHEGLPNKPNQLDDLMVRLFWIFHRTGRGIEMERQ
jgi:tetratricopeptide (TPR) repeat protein